MFYCFFELRRNINWAARGFFAALSHLNSQPKLSQLTDNRIIISK